MTNYPRAAFSLSISRTWDNRELPGNESTDIFCHLDTTGLYIRINANFHNDEAPQTQPGPTDSLWEYEVVELFLLGDNGHYLEIEFGPHGHYLVIQFEGVRKALSSFIPMGYQTEIAGKKWKAWAHLPLSFLPPNPTRINAYAIHGQGNARQYLAAFPVPGPRPDFHQPQHFHSISELNSFSSLSAP